ncbi:MAG: A24 family peptidase [Rhodocyclaceae bacterium]|nr:A24 family peptidase [Rhodocyclaceae bacterium]
MIGSFLNVVIHRLPIMMERDWRAQCAEYAAGAADVAVPPAPTLEPFTLVSPRSRCPHCGHPIGALENIPILSYLLLKGRCKGCGKSISPRYPLVEAITGLLFGYVAWTFGATFATACALIFVAALVALTFIDLDTQLLPDDITLPLLWAGLLINVGNTFTTLTDAVIGAAAGYLVLWSVYWLFKLLTGKEGMGYGDFKLLGALGAWFGAGAILPIILMSSVVGAVVGGTLMALRGQDSQVPMPFGPFIAAAGFAYLILAPQIRAWLPMFAL